MRIAEICVNEVCRGYEPTTATELAILLGVVVVAVIWFAYKK